MLYQEWARPTHRYVTPFNLFFTRHVVDATHFAASNDMKYRAFTHGIDLESHLPAEYSRFHKGAADVAQRWSFQFGSLVKT